MRKLSNILILFLVFFCTVPALAQMRKNAAYELYFSQFSDLAIEQMKRYRIPASITLAQGVFESNAGRSRLATVGNNHFGIKCHGWNGRSIYADDDYSNECFRAYDSAKDSYEDHSRFLKIGRASCRERV